jgi:hypothetical protein
MSRKTKPPVATFPRSISWPFATRYPWMPTLKRGMSWPATPKRYRTTPWKQSRVIAEFWRAENARGVFNTVPS